jgi:hypothetical protein
MIGVMLRGRPTPLKGALVVPKQRRLERMCRIERSLQPATSAIWGVVSELSRIMSRMRSCCDAARFGAIVTPRDVVEDVIETSFVRSGHSIASWSWR